MAEILQLRRPKAGERHKGASLCRHNHHKWETVNETRFDVKQGRLVTLMRCARCGVSRVRSS